MLLLPGDGAAVFLVYRQHVALGVADVEGADVAQGTHFALFDAVLHGIVGKDVLGQAA